MLRHKMLTFCLCLLTLISTSVSVEETGLGNGTWYTDDAVFIDGKIFFIFICFIFYLLLCLFILFLVLFIYFDAQMVLFSLCVLFWRGPQTMLRVRGFEARESKKRAGYGFERYKSKSLLIVLFLSKYDMIRTSTTIALYI